MINVQPRASAQYATLAAVTRGDLAPHLRPSDWGTGTRNSLRAALELFDLLAAGAKIVMPDTREKRESDVAMTIQEATASLNGTAHEIELLADGLESDGKLDEACGVRDWADVVRDQLSLFTFIMTEFVDGKVAHRFIARLAEEGGQSPAKKAESLLRLAMQGGAFAVEDGQ